MMNFNFNKMLRMVSNSFMEKERKGVVALVVPQNSN
jgi:hypothetical protein